VPLSKARSQAEPRDIRRLTAGLQFTAALDRDLRKNDNDKQSHKGRVFRQDASDVNLPTGKSLPAVFIDSGDLLAIKAIAKRVVGLVPG